MTWLVSTASAGAMTVRFGRVRATARSSRLWWLAPSGPVIRPACVTTTFTLALEKAKALRNWSKARVVANMAKVEANTVLPLNARPVAAPNMFCSAMPKLKKRSGNFLANSPVLVEPERSASRTTTFLSFAPSATRVSPYASRMALASPTFRGPTGFGCSRLPKFLTQLGHGALHLFLGERAPVIVSLVLRERNPFSLRGVGLDEERPLAAGFGFLEHVQYLVVIVSIDFGHVPAEGLELVQHGHDIHDVFDGSINLELVPVQDGHEVVQLVVRGRHGGLPNLSLLALAVAQHAVHPPRLLVEFGGQCHAHGHGQALSKGSRAGLDSRAFQEVGMPLQP